MRISLPRKSILVAAIGLGIALLGTLNFVTPIAIAEAEEEGDAMIESVDLEAHQWEDRVLLLFAPTADDPDFEDMQQALEENSSAVEERDLVVYRLFFETDGAVGGQPIASEAARALAQDYEASDDGFTLILIGKDGGEKMRAEEVIESGDIFDRVDSMPMRQREMDQSQR